MSEKDMSSITYTSLPVASSQIEYYYVFFFV